MNIKRLACLFLVAILPGILFAQQQDRILVLQQKLNTLSARVPGLSQKVQLSVTGVPVKEYLNALSRSNNISISSDPGLNFTVFDTFTDVSANNILVFLAQKYNLDITVNGSIIYITPYQDPALLVKPPPRELKVVYVQDENKLTLELYNDSLAAVARKVIQLTGKNVIVPLTLQNRTISAFISNAPFDAALEKLAFLNEFKLVHTPDNFYLFQPLAENEELYINSDKSTAVRKVFRPLNPGTPMPNSGMISRVVNGEKVLSADVLNGSLADLVKQASIEAGKDYSIYSDIKGTITIHVNDLPYERFLNLLFKGTSYTYHGENGVYFIGDKTLEGLRAFKLIHLENRSIDTVRHLIPAEWKKGLEITEFREQNTLLLSGSSAQIAEVEAFVRKLDVLVPVVMIEVTLIDFHKTRTVATGISAGTSDSIKTGGTILPGLDYTLGSKSVNDFLNRFGKLTSLNLGHVAPNFYVNLSALESNRNVDIRSVPRLSALNGHSATLSIGNKVYYKDVTQSVYPSTTSTSSIFSTAYRPVEANLAISITPIVSGNDQVTLGISVNISDFTSLPTDGSPPAQAISKFETSLRVHSDDTIVLGGIERTETNDSVSGVPLLSRIPLLKYLFSSKTKTNGKVVTVLFIKSTIIR